MVERPPVAVRIDPMTLADLPAVHAIERASFFPTWPEDAYRNELLTNKLATYLVARLDGVVVAFGGIWLMVDEAHITTFAVDPAWRRRSIGERLLVGLFDAAIARRAREATLEVRLSNVAARRLYEKYGFRPVGIRPRYYSDNGEDALIMTTEPLDEPPMRERLARLRAGLEVSGVPIAETGAATDVAPAMEPEGPPEGAA
jgi:[ribosomal protein S18]-alanine N-acetyltransferase